MKNRFIISAHRKWIAFKIAEALVFGIGVGLISMGMGYYMGFESFGAAVVIACVTSIGWVLINGMFTVKIQDTARYLSSSVPQFENSVELLMRETDQLNTIENLQRQRIEQVLNQSKQSTIPFHWRIPVLSLVAGSLVCLMGFQLMGQGRPMPPELVETEEFVPVKAAFEDENPAISSLHIRINPPAYTGLGVGSQSTPEISALEASKINWEFEFSMLPDSAFLIFASGGRLQVNSEGLIGRAGYRAYFNDLYQIEISYDGQADRSEFYPVRISKDASPKITLLQKEPFMEVEPGSIASIEIGADIEDDFSIKEAKIIATVAKGSGESVKFREVTIPFDDEKSIGKLTRRYTKTIMLDSLGLGAGDELYYYVMATDNKYPQPNIAKSETYFLSLIDSSEVEFSLAGSLGVDLMPDYFRSQRQLIIDTEKLIKEQSEITQHDFNYRSNELGFDQKVLRLKYGQFMGEEFVSDAGEGVEAMEAEASTESANVEDYTHDHDSENEHNLLEVNDVGEEFGHSHDNSEENTYFFMSVRTKLKEAMSQMWDAELYLRLYQPRKSLPYQYKALELIKEIKNHARIYVQRMGFDPPPIKEAESRLKGKALEDVISSQYRSDDVAMDAFVASRQLLSFINAHLATGTVIPEELWQQTGDELVPLAIEAPGTWFEIIQQLQAFRDGQTDDYDRQLAELYVSLSPLIPNSELLPSSSSTRSLWNKAFTDQLKETP